MIENIKHWLKYRRVRRQVQAAYHTAFYMQHWGRANNLIDRLHRVIGHPKQHRLAVYQAFKRNMLDTIGYKGEWKFDPYTLS